MLALKILVKTNGRGSARLSYKKTTRPYVLILINVFLFCRYMKSLATSAFQRLRTPHCDCLSSLTHPAPLLTSRPLAPRAIAALQPLRSPRHHFLSAAQNPLPRL
jgi:hypothetical protein